MTNNFCSLTGADLFTGTNLLTTVAWLHGRLPLTKMLMHWFLCFWGNIAGCLFVMAVITGCTFHPTPPIPTLPLTENLPPANDTN